VHSLAKELGEHRGSAWKSQSQNSVLWPAAEGRDRAGVSPAELGVHCSSKAAGRNRRWSFMGTEIYRNRVQRGFCQKLQCQWTLNNVSSEDAAPTSMGRENSHTRISPSSCTGAWTEVVPHLLSSALTGRVHNIWCLQQLSECCGNIQKVLVP